jgi:hypothetical protein
MSHQRWRFAWWLYLAAPHPTLAGVVGVPQADNTSRSAASVVHFGMPMTLRSRHCNRAISQTYMVVQPTVSTVPTVAETVAKMEGLVPPSDPINRDWIPSLIFSAYRRPSREMFDQVN